MEPSVEPHVAGGGAGDDLKSRIMEFWQQRAASATEEMGSLEEAKGALSWALGKLPVSLFPKVPKVYEVMSTACLRDAISLLEQHNFRCLPVRNAQAPQSQEWRERYLGVIDHAGIMLWVFFALGGGAEEVSSETEFPSRALLGLAASTAAALYAESDSSRKVPEEQPERAREGEDAGGGVPEKGAVPKGAWYATTGVEGFRTRFRDEILKNDIFTDNKVGNIIGSFRFTPFFPVDPSESVLSVLLLMAKERVRLAPIMVPQDEEIENVVTPMGVLDFLCQCEGLPWFDRIASEPLSALGLPCIAPNAIVKVEEGDRLMEPFRLMLEHDVSGIPVVASGVGPGEAGEVVGNVSASDILHLLRCPHLFEGDRDPKLLTVADLIEGVQEQTKLGGKREFVGPVLKPAICCRSEDPLFGVMKLLRRMRIRRIYVTGGEKGTTLKGVVTVRDIIAVFTGSDIARPSREEAYGA